MASLAPEVFTLNESTHPDLAIFSHPLPRTNTTRPSSQPPTTAIPPWVELKTKAGKARKRLPQACAGCRGKKIRCSGEKPSCKQCEQARAACWYSPPRRGAGGAERGSRTTDYATLLAKRLKRLDELVGAVVAESTAQKETVAADCAVPLGRKRTADEAVGATVSVKEDGSCSAKRQCIVAFADQAPKHLIAEALLDDGMESLPPADMVRHLVQVYFDNLHCQAYTLIHRLSFLRDMR